MAQSKRRRDASESDEDESDAQIESSSRSNRHSRSKRTRLSTETPAPNGTHPVSDDDDALEDVYTHQYTAPKNDASLAIDIFSSDEDEGEEEEVDEMRASEYIKESMKKPVENKPSESGIIQEVSMRNFMCHSRLTIPLGPLINFIIGHNGSGKSAILTALTVAFGIKAKSTNRAGKIQDFIKEGEDYAWVSIKLKNQGENAYQPDLYGTSIIAERHWTRSGASSFKIKNSEGRLISTKKSDLQEITDFFALQIDNPLNVLSQDEARQFLTKSNPKDKYKFFIKGTQLEQLDEDYVLMEGYVDQSEASTEARREDLTVLGERKRIAKEKQKMLDRTETIQTQINEALWMHAWAQIEEQERNLAGLDAQISQHDQIIQQAQRKADDASHIYEEEDGNHGANIEVIADLEEQLLPRKETRDEIKEKFDDNKKKLSESIAGQRQIKTDIDRYKRDIATAERSIAAEHSRIENANGPAHARKIVDLEETKAKLPGIQERYQQHRDGKVQLDKAVQDAQRQVEAARPPIEQKQAELSRADGLLATLRKDQGDQMKAFSRQILEVVRTIKSETRFRNTPVGPMGLFVRIKKPEWASVIERTFGGQMDAFIVTNKHDQGVLAAIMKRHNCHANILIGSSTKIDVSRNEPEQDVDTILRVLEIENDLVRNALIINQRIEQTVLIPRRPDANAFSQRRKPNVHSVMSHHETIRGQGWRFESGRGGNKLSPVPKWERAIRMKTNAEDQIRLQQDSIAQIKRDIDQLQRQRREKEEHLKNAKQAVVRHDQEAKNLRLAVQQTEDSILQLENELSEDNINDTGVLEELQQQLEDARNNLQTAKDSYGDSVAQKDRIDDAQRAAKQELDAATAAVQEMEAKINKAKSRADQKKRTRDEALLRKNHALGLLAEAEGERQVVVEKREVLAGQVDEMIPQAENVHPRVPVPAGMTPEKLDQRLEKLVQEKNKVQQRIGGSRDQIYREAKDAEAIFKKANDDLNQVINNAKLIKASLLNRKGRWRKFRKYITSRAQIYFMYLLSERGFRGRIIVNHSDKMLDINVEPDSTKASDAGRQTGTLSGGEKSFSTICLLLSIWEAMGSPIRCLDEFDVFMDQANRDVSMQMMVKAARRSIGKQFILITPQAMTAVEGWHDVKIFKMKDPERGQTTLPYGEQSR